MTIRKQDDALSRVSVQESKYFDKQDKTVTSSDFNRFLYMTPGNKNKFYDWRLDWSKKNFLL